MKRLFRDVTYTPPAIYSMPLTLYYVTDPREIHFIFDRHRYTFSFDDKFDKFISDFDVLIKIPSRYTTINIVCDIDLSPIMHNTIVLMIFRFDLKTF